MVSCPCRAAGAMLLNFDELDLLYGRRDALGTPRSSADAARDCRSGAAGQPAAALARRDGEGLDLEDVVHAAAVDRDLCVCCVLCLLDGVSAPPPRHRRDTTNVSGRRHAPIRS